MVGMVVRVSCSLWTADPSTLHSDGVHVPDECENQPLHLSPQAPGRLCYRCRPDVSLITVLAGPRSFTMGAEVMPP